MTPTRAGTGRPHPASTAGAMHTRALRPPVEWRQPARALSRVGLLEDGRGLAATLQRVDGPGRRRKRCGVTVDIWVVRGRKVTNRAGAAEYLGLSPNTVTAYSSPSGRRAYGWPEPLPDPVDGWQVFALADLDAFAAARSGAKPRRPRTGDPQQLLTVAQFAALKGIALDTMRRYVTDSLNAWARGRDGYLPQPDVTEPARHGHTYQWRRATALAWIAPAARRTGGRRPGRRPQPADLRTVLHTAGPGPRPTVRELAAALSDRLGTEVSSQTVRRLLRQLRDGPQPEP